MALTNINVPLYDDNCSERKDIQLTVNGRGESLVILTLTIAKNGTVLAEVDCIFEDLKRACEAVKGE